MNFTPEQLMAANKANVETLFGLTAKAFEGVEKLVELNLQVARTSLSEAAETTQAAMAVKDAQELLALQASLLQPAAEKAASYSRHLYDIMAGTNAEVAKVAEAQMADGQKKAMALAPQNDDLRLTLAKIYLESGDKVNARTELDTLAQRGDKFGAQAEVRRLMATL